ncbi:MAG: Spy/CpxP family protein refolding chaperone [Thiolinea sp.]
MKKSILALALVSALGLGAVTSVFAEDPVPGQAPTTTATNATAAETQAQRDAKMAEHIEKRVSRMKEKLGLTDEQAAQLKTIMTEQHTKREALRTETETRITGVLTPEQATKLKSFRDDHKGFGMEDGKGRHGGGHRGGHGGGHGGGWGDKPAE